MFEITILKRWTITGMWALPAYMTIVAAIFVAVFIAMLSVVAAVQHVI